MKTQDIEFLFCLAEIGMMYIERYLLEEQSGLREKLEKIKREYFEAHGGKY